MNPTNTDFTSGIVFILEQIGMQLQTALAQNEKISKDSDMYYRWYRESSEKLTASDAKIKELQDRVNSLEAELLGQ
jgi:hypothetical protein